MDASTTTNLTACRRSWRSWSRAVTATVIGGVVSVGSVAALSATAAATTGRITSATARSSVYSTAASRPVRRTERFQVGSSKPAGPGTIIVTGVIDAGGLERPGPAVDSAVFTGGGFRIDHSVGHPTAHFNPKTCVGTITESGPFRVFDGTGRFSRLKGLGSYRFHAVYTTARNGTNCTKTMTAYIETIDGTITVPRAQA